MYRIELAPGEVTVFRTIEELATGVRNGVITSRARIFHNATQKWLPIEFHPHYKLALELPAGRTIETPPQKATEGPRFDNIATPIAPSTPSARGPNLPYIVVDEPTAEEPSPPSVASPPFAPPPVRPLPSMTAASAFSAYAAPTHFDSEHVAPIEIALAEVAPAEIAPVEIAPVSLVAEKLALRPVMASPALDLPKISYPEFTPAEEPVAETASGTQRRRRPLHLGGAVLVLVLGAYGARSAFSPARGAAAAETPAPAVADRPLVPPAASENASERTADVTPPASATPAPKAVRTGAPSPRTAAPSTSLAPAAPAPTPAPTPPASSGFAPALEPRAIVSAPAPKPAASVPAADSVHPIAPAPVDVDLSVPLLPGSEPLMTAPAQRGDSAMKRILKAVAGGKEPTPRR